jgi:hypothetical protein
VREEGREELEEWEEWCDNGWESECDKGMLESERLMIGV